jgi:hypothetical protein
MVHHFTFIDSNNNGVPLAKVRDCAVNANRTDNKRPLLRDDEDYVPDDRIAIVIAENLAIANNGKTIEEVIAKCATWKNGETAVAVLTALRDTLDVRTFSSWRE